MVQEKVHRLEDETRMADPLRELSLQLEHMQKMLEASLTDSADVAELKTKMKYLWGNGKPGKIDELDTATTGLNNSMWYMKGALWVIIGLMSFFVLPLMLFLAERYLAHR